MGRRITKTAKVTVFKELPGAVFYGDVLTDDIDLATRLQAIRHDYESTDCMATLWHELSQMGFGYDEICAAVLNPKTVTSCGYCGFVPPTAALLSFDGHSVGSESGAF